MPNIVITDVTLDAPYVKGTGVIEKTAYAVDGSICLRFHTAEGTYNLSVNLSGHGLGAPEGHIFVKAYGPDEGLAEALAKAGVAEFTGYEVDFGYGHGHLMKVR